MVYKGVQDWSTILATIKFSVWHFTAYSTRLTDQQHPWIMHETFFSRRTYWRPPCHVLGVMQRCTWFLAHPSRIPMDWFGAPFCFFAAHARTTIISEQMVPSLDRRSHWRPSSNSLLLELKETNRYCNRAELVCLLSPTGLPLESDWFAKFKCTSGELEFTVRRALPKEVCWPTWVLL